VSIGWSGADPPEVAPPGPAGRVRMVLRGLAAAVWTAVLFAVFLMARGIDKAVRAIWLGPVMGLAPWVVHGWARGALVLLGLRFRRVGRPMAHPGAVVANHSSWLDIVVLQRAMRVFFVSKSEVAGWPVIGLIGRAIGTMFIERRPVEAKRQQEVLYRRLKRGDLMCIFPEGTSTDGQRVLPFKSALFGVFLDPELHGRLWVQPVAIRYRAPQGLPAAFYGWWGEMDFGAHLARLLAQSRGGEVEVAFLEPLRAADFAGRKALAEAAQAAVAAGFGDSGWTARSQVDAGAAGGV
jgi:lyso-ornithine lipid O-acyltransferase